MNENFPLPSANEQEKPPVPQLNPLTHVSQDYVNEVASTLSFLSLGIDIVKQEYQAGSIQKAHTYQERFPEDSYANVITPENEQRVAQINELATRINELLDTLSSDNQGELKEALEKMVKLVQEV